MVTCSASVQHSGRDEDAAAAEQQLQVVRRIQELPNEEFGTMQADNDGNADSNDRASTAEDAHVRRRRLEAENDTLREQLRLRGLEQQNARLRKELAAAKQPRISPSASVLGLNRSGPGSAAASTVSSDGLTAGDYTAYHKTPKLREPKPSRDETAKKARDFIRNMEVVFARENLSPSE